MTAPDPTAPAARPGAREHLEAWRQALVAAHAHRALVMAALPALRVARGLGLRDVARRVGVSATTISLAEHGELDLSLDTAARLLGVLTTEDA